VATTQLGSIGAAANTTDAMASTLAPAAVLPVAPQPAHLLAVKRYYEDMLVAVMRTLAERWSPEYPFVDTKLDLGSATAADFKRTDPIRGHGAVYSWIQGRGLEALAGHCAWLRGQSDSSAAAQELELRLREILAAVLDTVQRMRGQNDGRLWFFMRPDDGVPFALRAGASPSAPPEPYPIELSGRPLGFSDVFTAKGLFAAAVELSDAEARADAVRYIERVTEAIFAGPSGFANDQEVRAAAVLQ
jgi:hypothetical protein